MKLALLFTFTTLAALAQFQDNREKKLTCDQNRSSSRPRFCKITEQTVSSQSLWIIDSGGNGGITVRGWSGRETLVRAKVESWGESDSAASLLGGQVQVDVTPGQVRASGPQAQGKAGWAVSFEVFVPHATSLNLQARNGGIHLSDVRGRLEFKTTNGGIHVDRVAGEVTGSTTNGGVHVNLSGGRWEGGPIHLSTTNGGVHLALPADTAAQVRARTTNGGVHSDFPLPNFERNHRPSQFEFNIGAGGPLINLSTTNGGVHIQRL
jgi:hypothetical protein